MRNKYKKILTATLAAAVMVTALFQGSVSVQAAPEEAGITEEIPYGFTPIYDIADLNAINSNLSGKYILMNDIDLSETAPGGQWDTGNGWVPIGSDIGWYDTSFNGTLDGNGHLIKNMHIYGNASGKIGLFARIDTGAKIRNLGLTDCDISIDCNDRTCIGGITAYVKNSSEGTLISNCFVTGSIKAAGSQSEGGPIYGDDYLYGHGCAGGIVGYIDSRNVYAAVSIADCYNAASLSFEGGSYIGGIVGATYEVEYPNNWVSCYNVGGIQGFSGQQIGGISGEDAKNLSKPKQLFYLKSSVSGGGRISNCGTGLAEAQMKTDRAFTGFDFKNTWYIDPLAGYGYPQLRRCPQAKVSGCELVTLPDKLEYAVGEGLDVSGGVLSVTYQDGIRSEIVLDDEMVSGYDAEKIGTQTVTVTYVNEEASFDVTVNEVPAASLQLNYDEYELNRNQRLNLEAAVEPTNATDQEVEWETDNELVAEVSDQGVVRGINAGTAVITARTSNGIEAACTITVKVPAKKLKLDVSKLTLKKGKKKRIKAVMTPLDSTDEITWISSNPKVAQVSSDGMVTAKKKGKAVVMAKTTSGISKKVSVYVK